MSRACQLLKLKIINLVDCVQDIEFSGDCETNYLEVRLGGARGEILEKFCERSKPRKLLETKSNGIFVKWVKEENDKNSSFNGTWMAKELKCCKKGWPCQIFLGRMFFEIVLKFCSALRSCWRRVLIMWAEPSPTTRRPGSTGETSWSWVSNISFIWTNTSTHSLAGFWLTQRSRGRS